MSKEVYDRMAEGLNEIMEIIQTHGYPPSLLRAAVEKVGVEKPSDVTLVMEEVERMEAGCQKCGWKGQGEPATNAACPDCGNRDLWFVKDAHGEPEALRL